NKKINHIAIVMDRSGSMGPLANEALSGLNDELKTIAKNAREFDQTTTISLVTFSTKVDEPRFLELEEEVTDYNCSGWTALNDAVGHTIQMLKSIEVAEGEDVAYLVLIVTDGMENSSREFSSEQIATMINELEQRGNWTFTFMGAGA